MCVSVLNLFYAKLCERITSDDPTRRERTRTRANLTRPEYKYRVFARYRQSACTPLNTYSVPRTVQLHAKRTLSSSSHIGHPTPVTKLLDVSQNSRENPSVDPTPHLPILVIIIAGPARTRKSFHLENRPDRISCTVARTL